jgi:predicted RNase H-like HicB family nuclease
MTAPLHSRDTGYDPRGSRSESAAPILHRGLTVKIFIKVIELDNEFIANCPELDVNCYGKTRNEAVRRLVSVLRFYIDSAHEMGLDVERLDTVLVEGDKNSGFWEREMIHESPGAIQ